jgi:MFS family permease
MQNVNTGWLMTSLTGSPMMVSLVQVAMSLPVFLVVLPAGALADTMDRRRLLLVTQSWMVLAAAALGVVTLFGMVTPWLLLAFTSLLGLGAVMNDPAWQAITPETVCGEHFPAAVALNSAAYNVARAIGPAAGGLVIVLAGSGAAFLLNAASFFGVILFLFRWKRPAQSVPHPRQRVLTAIGSGFQFVAGSHAMQAALLRTGLFSFCASALWALVPLIARPHGSLGYGIVLGFFGLGALLLAAIMPWLRQKNSVDVIVGGATVLFAGATFALGQVQPFWMLCVAMLLAGMGWIAVLASLNTDHRRPPNAGARVGHVCARAAGRDERRRRVLGRGGHVARHRDLSGLGGSGPVARAGGNSQQPAAGRIAGLDGAGFHLDGGNNRKFIKRR